ncbi:MAG: ExbD/TolR family protein [Oleiphilus sp.]
MLLDIAPVRRGKAISLTPLIDVVFILLLFFMLSSSFSRWFAVDVSLPMPSDEPPGDLARFELINNQGALLFNQHVLPLGSQVLLEQVKTLQQETKQPRVVLDAENSVSTQAIVRVMDYFKAQGLEQVSLGKTFLAKGKTQ